MIVDAATSADASAMGAIMSDWIDATPWMPRVHTRTEEQGFARMLVDKGWATVVRRAGVPVGFLARDRGEIHALYAAPQGQGVGKALLDYAKTHAPHLSMFAFQANVAAQRFYLREGFVETGRSDGMGNDENLPDIRYEWSAS